MAKNFSHKHLRNLVKDKKNEEVKAIIDKVDPMNLLDYSGKTVMHVAAKLGNIELIKYLLEFHRCTLDATTFSEMTPLMTALSNKQFETAKLLLNAKPTISDNNTSWMRALKMAVNQKVPADVIQEFIAYLRDYEIPTVKIVFMLERASCSLKYALKLNDGAILRLLMERRESISYQESSKLVRKAMQNTSRANVVNLLILIRYGQDWEIRKAIFFKELHKDIKGWLSSVNADYVKCLTRQMMKLNAIDRYFALYIAGSFEKGDKSAIKTWLESEVHVHVKRLFGRDLMAHLFGNKKVNAIELVKKMKLKLDVFGKSSGGYSALHFSVMSDISKNVEFLLEKGADPDFKSKYGMTPLFIAYDKKCVKLLLEYGADVQANDVEGLTILDVNHCSETHELLLAHLAIIEAKGDDVKSYMLDKISANRKFREFYERCRLQVTWMKRRKIFQSVTLFEALTDKPENIARFVANGEEGTGLMDWHYDCTLHRYYFKILKRNLNKAVQIYELKRKAGNFLGRSLRVYDTEHLVVRKIVGYLTYEDLLVFV